MKKSLAFVSNRSRRTAFRIFAITCLLIGFAVGTTSDQLGPLAPLLVPAGIYLALISIVLELAFSLKPLLRRLLHRSAA